MTSEGGLEGWALCLGVGEQKSSERVVGRGPKGCRSVSAGLLGVAIDMVMVGGGWAACSRANREDKQKAPSRDLDRPKFGRRRSFTTTKRQGKFNDRPIFCVNLTALALSTTMQKVDGASCSHVGRLYDYQPDRHMSLIMSRRVPNPSNSIFASTGRLASYLCWLLPSAPT